MAQARVKNLKREVSQLKGFWNPRQKGSVLSKKVQKGSGKSPKVFKGNQG